MAAVLASAGCLREPDAAPVALAVAPIDSRVDLAGPGGMASVAGRVSGTCGGPILIEAIGSGGAVVGRTRAKAGRWQVSGLERAPSFLRWGCDANGDGYVPTGEVAEGGPPRLSMTVPVLVLPAG